MELQGEIGWQNFDIIVKDNAWPDTFPCDGHITAIDVVLMDKTKSFSIKVGKYVLDSKHFFESETEVPGVYTAKKMHYHSEFKKGDSLDILSGANNIYKILIWVKV